MLSNLKGQNFGISLFALLFSIFVLVVSIIVNK